MKKLSKVAVMLTAIELMKDQGTTTTLEVKEALRVEGYFAKQVDVSTLMFKIAQEEDWVIDSSGIFRVYSLDSDYMAAGAGTVGINGSVPLRSSTIKHRNGCEIDVIELGEDEEIDGDWMVESNTELPMFFSQIYTRDEVRSAYAKLNNVSFAKVRSSRITMK